MSKFKNGDKVRYVKKAPEECGMAIELNEFIGTFENGIIISGPDWYKRIPLKGVCDITNCFEIVKEDQQ